MDDSALCLGREFLYSHSREHEKKSLKEEVKALLCAR